MSERVKKMIRKRDEKITQLNQKIIHYRSEVEKYKQHIVLLKKRYQQDGEVDDSDSVEVEEVFVSGASMDKVEENKEIVPPILSYFSYTTLINSDDEIEDTENKVNLFGQFTFRNVTNQTFEEPVICFRVRPSTKIRLGGKISHLTNMGENSTQLTEEWMYVQEDWKRWIAEKGEHWLKPIHLKELKPYETGRFTNFNISLTENKEQQYFIEGFFYAKNYQEGIPAVNTISVSL
ncbi:hypothetical protein [Evansella tamaricis]|uniref:Uncharacterized protein n=1 Tax=Evansella tamaricis TaxID=2069301 RepID=A0ABS6JHZ8_9BACI|nr:hypothetical protein [Evansella tamaricis]MBU9713297.1 hypothetical protein [Evansella tamaricis]